MDLMLRGKVALVTGGSRGLGAAVCRALAAEGAGVAVNYASSREKAEAVADALARDFAVPSIALGADVSDEAQVESLFERAALGLGGVDILVNNAGICPVADIVDLEFSEWRRVMAANLDSVFLCSRALAPAAHRKGPPRPHRQHRVARRRSTAQSAARRPIPRPRARRCPSPYPSPRRFARHGILVNAVAPGLMDTDMVPRRWAMPGEREKYGAAIPLGRLGTVRGGRAHGGLPGRRRGQLLHRAAVSTSTAA